MNFLKREHRTRDDRDAEFYASAVPPMTDQAPAADIVEQAKAARVFRDDRMVEMPEKLRDGLVAEITRLRAREAELELALSESKEQFDQHVKWASDQATELQRKLDEAVKAMPIESAPKDGTWIIGWGKDLSPYRISWGINHNGTASWCSAAGSFVAGYITRWSGLPDNLSSIRGEG